MLHDDHGGDAEPASAERVLTQEAPYPELLETLVRQLRYKTGWAFWLRDLDRGQGSKGLTLVVHITGPDSYHPEREIAVNHFFPVPPAAYDVRSWRRWLFDRVLLVERHEACEFFRFPVPPRYDPEADVHLAQPDDRPYAPSHGPGNDPYLIREVGSDLDQRTSFRGDVRP